NMRLSTQGLNLIKEVEGLVTEYIDGEERHIVYNDVAGLPTIGYGHLLTKHELSSGKISILGNFVKYHQGLTEAESLKLLDQDCDMAEEAVNQETEVKL